MDEIDGATRLVGVMGWPVAHSLSPAMHNAAFAALSLNWRYVPLPVHPDDVGAAVRGLRALGFAGCNVTVPHKQAVMPHLAGLSPEAAATGAVNTLVRAGGSWRGENTDVRGFMDDLAAHGVAVTGKQCVVLGAGGSARAVTWGLLNAGAAVAVVSRTLARSAALVEALSAHLPGAALSCHERTALAHLAADSTALIVNATSVGMWPHVDESPWPEDAPIPAGAVVYDLVYRPARTRLLQQAEAAGARAIGGVGMLARQGAASFALWTGAEPPVDMMMESLARSAV